MAEVIKSIGVGRDYSTISAWESDLDNGAVYNAGDDAIGELYDATYSEQGTVDNGGTLGLNSVTLRAHSTMRHAGRSGTGVRVVSQGFNPFWGAANSVTYNFEWFEYDGNGMDDSEIIAMQAGATTRLRNLVVHNAVHTSTTFACYGIRDRGSSANHEVDNCLVYNVEQTGGQRLSGILLSDSSTGKVRNCTVTDIRETNATSGDSQGINFLDSANHTIQNNLVTNITSTAGTAECYDNPTVTSAVTAGNVSDDATSPQSGLRNATISFQNSTNDDYRLAPGDTDAKGVGSDLGTGKIAIDLLSRDRDARGDTWDAGAFQYVETSFIESATEYVASNTTITLTHGMTINANDVLIAFVTLSAPGTISSTGGVFTEEIQEESPVNANTTYGIFSRVATASEASSWTFTSDGAAGRMSVHVLRFRGIRQDIWDVRPSASTRAIKNLGTSLDTAKALTTLSDDAIGIGFMYIDDAASTMSEFTIGPFRTYHGSGQCHYEAVQHFNTAGAQTAFNGVVSTADDITAHYVALRSASSTIPFFVGGASGSVTSGTAVTVTVSGIGIQEGDVIVAAMHSNEVAGALSGDATYTFTKDFEETNPSVDTGLYAVLSRVATASEPTSYQFNHSGLADRNEVQLSVFRHVSNASKYDVAPSTSTRASGDTGTTATSPTMTTSVDHSYGIVVALRDSGATTGYTAIDNDYTNEVSLGTNGDQCTFMWSRPHPSAGLKPAVNATLSATDAWVIHQFALRPDGGATGPIITDVDTDEAWDDGATGLIVTGTGFA